MPLKQYWKKSTAAWRQTGSSSNAGAGETECPSGLPAGITTPFGTDVSEKAEGRQLFDRGFTSIGRQTSNDWVLEMLLPVKKERLWLQSQKALSGVYVAPAECKKKS